MINFRKKSFIEFNTYFILLFLVLVTLARIIVLYFTPLGLSVDEAQYWDWSKTLELVIFQNHH